MNLQEKVNTIRVNIRNHFII